MTDQEMKVWVDTFQFPQKYPAELDGHGVARMARDAIVMANRNPHPLASRMLKAMVDYRIELLESTKKLKVPSPPSSTQTR